MCKLLQGATAYGWLASLQTSEPWGSAHAGPGKFPVRRWCCSGDTPAGDPPAAPGRNACVGTKSRCASRDGLGFPGNCLFRSRNGVKTRREWEEQSGRRACAGARNRATCRSIGLGMRRTLQRSARNFPMSDRLVRNCPESRPS